MKKTIAILIPCYNSATFLPELFTGIYAQTVPFDEIICYDDLSSDDTVAVAKSLGATVISGKENKGPAFARNRMLEATNCTFVHFHDSDDLIHANFVEEMLIQLGEKNEQLIANSYVLDRNDRSIDYGSINYDNLINEPDQVKYFLENTGYASMGVYNKQDLLSIGGFNENLIGHEDPDLHIRLSIANYKVKPTGTFLVTKLEHAVSLSHTRWFQCMVDKLTCLKHYYEILPSKYHQIIGLQALVLSNFFYREGDTNLSDQALELALKCKLKKINSSSFSSIISSLFGVEFYTKIYRYRTKLNKWLH